MSKRTTGTAYGEAEGGEGKLTTINEKDGIGYADRR